jgi:hypothetical protein
MAISRNCDAKFVVLVRYRGQEPASELPLTGSMIARLALEATSRGLTMSELVGELIATVAKRGQSSTFWTSRALNRNDISDRGCWEA